MSSSSSNAAARRRRAGPPPMQNNVRPPPGAGLVNANVRVPPGAAPPNGAPAQANQNAPQQQAKPPMTPAQMLISHEKRLMEIESSVPDMIRNMTQEIGREIDSIKTIRPAESVASDNNSQEQIARLEMQLDEVEERMLELMNSYRLINDLTTEMNTTLLRFVNAQQQPAQTVESLVPGGIAYQDAVDSTTGLEDIGSAIVGEEYEGLQKDGEDTFDCEEDIGVSHATFGAEDEEEEEEAEAEANE